MLDAMQFEFMRHAVAAGLLAAVICGVMGTLVVVNRVVFLSGGIAHAAYGGIGLSFCLGWPFLPGTIGFALVAAIVMAAVTLRAKHRSDTIVGVIWAVGMAVGIVLIDLTPGYQVDLMSYLFGSILTVPGGDLWMMLAVGAGVCFLTAYFYEELIAMAYDEEFAISRGVPVRRLYFLFICMLAVSIVLIIQIVGLILVIALLTMAPYIAERYTKSLFAMMTCSALLNIIFTLCGLWLAYRFNITSGAAIILVAAATFLLESIGRLLPYGTRPDGISQPEMEQSRSHP